MNQFNEYNTVEEFILDEDFFLIAKRISDTDSEEWLQLLASFPEKGHIMKEAFFFIKTIKLKKTQVPPGRIREDYQLLQKAIGAQRRVKLIRYWGSAAACIALFVTIGFGVLRKQASDNRSKHLLSILENTEINSTEIELDLGGKETMRFDGDAEIIQDHKGTMKINSNTLVEAKKEEIEYIQINVPYGKRSFVEFSDGTRAWLNSGSKLIYPPSFERNIRDIYVEGEIYLEVAKDQSRPFHVKTKDLNVEVLGTAFNVSSYKDDDFSHVVLVNGSVKVHTEQKEDFRLTPDNLLLYKNGVATLSKVNVSDYTCWKDGLIKLKQEPLADIFKKLSRYYNVVIEHDTTRINSRYNGKLLLKDNIESILSDLAVSDSIHYTIKGKTIQIEIKDQ